MNYSETKTENSSSFQSSALECAHTIDHKSHASSPHVIHLAWPVLSVRNWASVLVVSRRCFCCAKFDTVNFSSVLSTKSWNFNESDSPTRMSASNSVVPSHSCIAFQWTTGSTNHVQTSHVGWKGSRFGSYNFLGKISRQFYLWSLIFSARAYRFRKFCSVHFRVACI